MYGPGPYFSLAVLLVITVVGGPATLFALVDRRDWFYALWLGVLAFIWYQVLRTAFAIRVEGERCEFRALARRTVVPGRQIESVRASWMGGNVVTVRHRDGKVLLLQPMEGFHEFLAWLKAVNPAVELRGV